MKNYKERFKKLLDYYKEELSNLKKEEVEIVAKLEVFLYLLEEINFKNKDISKTWALLTGYHKNEQVNVSLMEKEIDLINKARGFLTELYGSKAFDYYIETYMNITNINELLYSLRKENKDVFFQVNYSKKLEERKKRIKELFGSEIDIVNNKMKIFKEGVGKFYEEGVFERVKFKEIKLKDKKTFNKISIKRPLKRESITIKKSDLLKTAKFIDSKIENKNYVERVKNINFDILKDNSIEASEEITIDGLFNLVGRVGAGKSTLVEVLSCKLALEGRKTAIIVDSIKAIVELLDYYDNLGINAVPIWGYSGKEEQRNKAYSSIREEDFNDIYNTSWNKWFSETCILDGLRDSSDIIEPFKAGKEPCMKILKNKKSKEKFACPYYNICPSHKIDLSLNDAQIYITTPSAFLKTKISPAIVEENVRVSEYLYYNCDLVVFDESDKIQLNFEQGFTEHIIIMDDNKESYLNKLGRDVEIWFYNNRITNASNKKLQKWHDIFNNTQRSANILIQLLNDNKSLIKKLDGMFLTAYSLHDRFKNLKEYTKFNIMENFIKIDEEKLDNEGKYIRTEILSGNFDFSKLIKRIKKWYFNEKDVSYDDILMIVFIFVLTIFEKNFKDMVNGLEFIPELQSITTEDATVMYRIIEDYLPFIPTSPMGNVFGIKITADNNNNLKRLVLFKSRGLGRWLLTNYHNLYENIDKEKGPNVLLLSGTSWAPKSYSYHIKSKVDGILNGHEDEAKAIEESKFMFEYVSINNSPIEVSGSNLNKRVEKIETIVKSLVKVTGRTKKSKLAQELDKLEENRKKILLLVGSYKEATAIKKFLDVVLTNDGYIKKEEVCLLVRDNEEEVSSENITRGDVTEFGTMDKKILIAPLMALERGYNILNENNKAAIGSVYFLVRPMPIPNDMNIIVNKINSRCMENLSDKNSKDILEHINWVKSNRDESLKLMQKLLIKSERLGYKQLNDEDREALCMTLFVTICQVVGRLIRGGCKARVHFCDAKFAPNTIINEEDTEKTSILVGIIKTLDKLMESENVIERELTNKLYYPFYKGLKECEGLKYEKRKRS